MILDTLMTLVQLSTMAGRLATNASSAFFVTERVTSRKMMCPGE
jgi:hypothetical protein